MFKPRKSYPWLLTALVLIFASLLAACQPTATPSATAAPTEASEGTAAPAGTAVPGEPTTPAATPTPFVLEGATTTDTGLQYLEIEPGTGAAPKAGEIVTMQYVVSLPDGSEIASTYTNNEPASVVWGVGRLLPGWEEGVGLMKVGGKSKLVLPPNLAFGEQGNAAIPPNSQIVMEVELLRSEAAPTPAEHEEADLTTSDTGLQWMDITVGEGAEAVKNTTVATQYTVWVKTEDGYTYVEQSQGSDTVDFVVGRLDSVFAGWDEGVTGMKEGGKRLLVIPPEIGVGAQGNAVIPANSTLVMEITLVSVREPQVATKVDEKDYTRTESGLKYYDLKEGEGETPKAGQTVVVQYTGWLQDGTQFDSSIDAGQPLSFRLGQGDVIPGWDEGVATMKVGSKRQLVIPPELGYGETGAGNLIPPNSTLIFEVELLEIQD